MMAGCKENIDGKQGMTHAWMRMTNGRRDDKKSMQIMANWPCESCGYEHAYPQVFTDLRFDLREDNSSAVGDAKKVPRGVQTPAFSRYTGVQVQSGSSSSNSPAPQIQQSCNSPDDVGADPPNHSSGSLAIGQATYGGCLAIPEETGDDARPVASGKTDDYDIKESLNVQAEGTGLGQAAEHM